MPLLATHPGVGPLTAVYFPLVIGDPRRFARGRQVVSYLGLNPTERSSGGRQRLGGISKQGNALLRFLLVEAAGHIRKDPELHRFYSRLVHRKGPQTARVAVARKAGHAAVAHVAARHGLCAVAEPPRRMQ